MTDPLPIASASARLEKLALFALKICTGAAVFCLLVFFFHLFGLLLATLLTLFFFQNWARARRNYIRNFNSALQATVRINGSVEKTARAFSTSGPLRSRCAFYASQLAGGAAPLKAGIASGLPLDIETALAFSLPVRKEQPKPAWQLENGPETESKNHLSIASQLFYLIFICIGIFACSGFYDLLVFPTMEMILSENSFSSEVSPSASDSGWMRVTTCLLGLGVITFYITAILGFPSVLLSASWVPLLPFAAAKKSTTLNAIANSIEAGCPLNTFCELGMMLYKGSERLKFAQAFNALKNGESETRALAVAGWIRDSDRVLLEGSTPQRMSEILRSIARQDIRHANSNLNWIMAILFPALILCLAASISLFASSFFTELYGLTLSLTNQL
jgi:hypothetical protein